MRFSLRCPERLMTVDAEATACELALVRSTDLLKNGGTQ